MSVADSFSPAQPGAGVVVTVERSSPSASAPSRDGADAWLREVRQGLAVAATEPHARQVQRFLAFRGTQPGEVIEVQILESQSVKFRQTFAARTSSAARVATLTDLAPSWSERAMGVFFVMNAVNPAILARAPADDWALVPQNGGTTDADIPTRRAVFLDHDPVRPRGVSADEAERALALEAAERTYIEILSALPPELRSAVGFADSGNGFHVYLATEIPATARAAEVIKAFLIIASELFSAPGVKIDASVGDAKRLCPVPGTPKRKGQNTVERPHRRTSFWGSEAPARLELDDLLQVTTEWLRRTQPGKNREAAEKLLGLGAPSAKSKPTPAISASRAGSSRGAESSLFDLVKKIPAEEVAEKLGLLVDGVLTCPGCGEVEGVRFTPEANGVKCFHDRCSLKGQSGFRTTIDLAMEVLGEDARGAARWLAEQFEIAVETGSADSALSAGAVGDWESPLPFERPRTPAPFPVSALPTVLAEWAAAESVETQTPVDLAAFLALAVCSAAVAKKFIVHVTGQWKEGLNLYVLGALPPGTRKSAVFEHASRPLYDYEVELQRQTGPKIRTVQVARDIHARERERLLKAAATDESAKALLGKLSPPPELPAMPRLVADDVTTEALTRVLAEQDGRLALLSPEGGFFTVLGGAYSEKVNIDVILKAWGGENVVVDRVGRPTVTVEGATLTIGLTVQPHVVQEFVSNKVFAERGLTARFLYFLPEDMLGRREIEPPPAPTHVVSAYHDTVLRLLQLPLARDARGRVRPEELILSRDAHQELLAFRRELEARMGAGGDLSHMSGWASKLPGALVRVAGIMTLVKDNAARAIDVATIGKALLVGDYLIEHAQAALGGTVMEVSVADAKHILAWVKRLKLSKFSRRECFNAHRARFRQVQDLEPVLDALVQHHYLRDITPAPAGPGRPSTTYEVNPEFLAQNSQNAHNV